MHVSREPHTLQLLKFFQKWPAATRAIVRTLLLIASDCSLFPHFLISSPSPVAARRLAGTEPISKQSRAPATPSFARV